MKVEEKMVTNVNVLLTTGFMAATITFVFRLLSVGNWSQEKEEENKKINNIIQQYVSHFAHDQSVTKNIDESSALDIYWLLSCKGDYFIYLFMLDRADAMFLNF